MARYLQFPLTVTTLLVVGAFTLALLLAAKIGLLGIAIAVPVVAWFFQYCYLQLDAILAGRPVPHTITLSMVNPLRERRAIAQASLMAAGAGIVFAVVVFFGFIVGALCCIVLLLCLPSSMVVLAATGSAFGALWPPALIRYARTCGAQYRAAWWVIVALGSLLFALLRFAAPSWIIFSATQLMLLVGFALVGGALFEHRRELGIAPEQLARREAQRAAGRRTHLRRVMLKRARLNLESGKPADCWREIQTWIGQHGKGPDAAQEHKALLEVTCKWDDPRPADRLTDDLVAILLGKRQLQRALMVLEQRLATNPRFRPKHRTQLAGLAAAAGKSTLRHQLESSPPSSSTQPVTQVPAAPATTRRDAQPVIQVPAAPAATRRDTQSVAQAPGAPTVAHRDPGTATSLR